MGLAETNAVLCTTLLQTRKKRNFVVIDVITTERLSKCIGRNVKYKAYTTMNKLIKEAEKLYKEIDSIQMIWVASTKDNDEEGKKHAIGSMSIAMCSAMQLLKCFIERKDNIVDLREVFHSVTEEPDRTKDILIDSYTVGYYVPTTISFEEEKWNHCISNYAIKRWAYIKDLLPKGGEAWNTTK